MQVCNVDEEGRFGGPERRIVLVAQELKRHGVDTHVVYPTMDSRRFADELARAGITNSPLNITRLSKEKKILVRYILFFPTEVWRLWSFFKKHRFALVHVNGSYQFKVAVAAKLARIPVVWHLNDTNMSGLVKKLSIVIASHCVAGFIVAGERVRDFYIRGTGLERRPCMEIHAPVDTKVFDPERVAPDKRLDGPHGRRIATVSGINPTKGLEYFITMASMLLEGNEDLVFYVAGAEFSSQRKYYESLKRLIASTIPSSRKLVFLGMVDDVPGFIQAADICVLTSIAEASPTAVWEAMSMGKPVVSTDVGSVSRYIENGMSGFIVPVRDPESLAEKVRILLDNPELRVEMGHKARVIAQNHLDITWAAKKHALFYDRILALTAKRRTEATRPAGEVTPVR